MTSKVLSAVETALERGDEADEVLRATVTALVADPRVEWAGIAFVEAGSLVLGPQEGAPDESRRARVDIVFEGARVGELIADGAPDPDVLEAVASLIAPYVLIGWDTGGEPWKP